MSGAWINNYQVALRASERACGDCPQQGPRRSKYAAKLQWANISTTELDEQTLSCLHLWSRYIQEVLDLSFPIDIELYNSDLFETVCEMLGFSRTDFKTAYNVRLDSVAAKAMAIRTHSGGPGNSKLEWKRSKAWDEIKEAMK